MQPVAILGAGMVTGVGLNAPASCAAIRCGIQKFSETRFMDKQGKWIIGSQVVMNQLSRGLSRLVKMIAPAIKECLAYAENVKPESVPLILCVAETERPGRFADLEDRLFQEVQRELGVRFHGRSVVVAQGRVGGAIAMGIARRLILEEGSPLCLIAGVDSLLAGPALAEFDAKARLLTNSNSNGFIPGEAGAVILIGPAINRGVPGLVCYGIGSGEEKASIDSTEPLRADGLVQAIRSAFTDAELGYEHVDYRITDANGEQYWFKEAALALTRTIRVRKARFELWHVADCIGDTGAAAAPCGLALALSAALKKYAPGPGVLCHFGDDAGQRVSLVLRSTNGQISR
jgi:3-oxoacyl-[acyl-carrier-protein] synthase-1